MMRHWVSRVASWGCRGPQRVICTTQCVFQRGQWGGQRGGGRRDYGDQGNQGDYGGQRGGGRRDYGDQGNQGDYGGQRGGGRRDYGDQGNRGDYGGQRGGGRRDYGDQGNRGDHGGQRGGGRRDYGDQGNRGDHGGQRGGGRRDYGDQGNQGDYGGQRGGGRRDYGDQGNQGDHGGQRGGGRRDYGDQGNRGDYGGQRGGGRRDYGDQGNQGDYGGQRGGGRRDYGGRGGRERYSRGGNSTREGHNQGEGGAEERPLEGPFDEQAAKNLFELKRQYKHAKSGRDRRDIQREARRAIRRARVDPSTQDEKTVTLLLNCAATFHSYPHSEGIKQAIQWMRQNIAALSPQNLALFANALGTLSAVDSDIILLQEVTPAVQSVFTQMSPVELVMILQAFQRNKIFSNASLQESMLRQLSSCVSQMPAPQLSTLAGVLVSSPLRKSDETTWQELTNAVLSKAVSGVDNMHSREVITLLKAAPHLLVPEEPSLQLIQRAIDTVGFHTDEQVGEILESVAGYRNLEKPPGEKLSRKLDELVNVLWTRLQKVAPHVDASSATWIMHQSCRCGVDVPPSIMEVMLEAVAKDMRYHRYTFRRCAALAEALAEQKAPAKALLLLLGDYCIGRRPPREDREEADLPDEEEVTKETRMDIYSRFLGDLTRARIALENAHSANSENGEPGESVRVILPQRLEESVSAASPRELLKCIRVICTSAEDCQVRNRANDEKLMTLAEQRMSSEREGFLKDVPKEFLEEFLGTVKDRPRAQKVVLACTG
ncbi:mitochondrial oligo-U binding protein TBRGG1 [Trypanosoma cruzi]|nr:mitochondrial oligo-U binding protein TBRGG1 [Trypanosoma cruzi]